MPFLDRITVFPIKSLDGVEVHEARVLSCGALEHDRRWQLVDMEGRVMNAKRTPLMHGIRVRFHIEGLVDGTGGMPLANERNSVEVAVDPVALAIGAIPGIDRLGGMTPETFPLVPGSEGPCGWLSEVIGQAVLLVERRNGGFPDDRDAPGPTLVATATLIEVARWFGFDLDECRRRLRVNLEVGGCDAFWEDSLASPRGPEWAPSMEQSLADLPADPYAALPPPQPRAIHIGDVRLQATNVCRRCVVPSRHSRTGVVTEYFRDAFEARRSLSLRPDVEASSWSHQYRLAINTRADAAGTVRRGDSVVTP
jgi:uncharacterized protein YcbX